MSPGELKAKQLLEQLDHDSGQQAAAQPTGHSVSDWVYQGVVGAILMALRLIRTGIPVPEYWQRTILRAVEEIARELQRNGH